MIGKTLGHYQITDKLGEGGMAVVWEAKADALRDLAKRRLEDRGAVQDVSEAGRAAEGMVHGLRADEVDSVSVLSLWPLPDANRPN